MKEYGIPFNGAMVRAIIDGSKTVTRRPVKLAVALPDTAHPWYTMVSTEPRDEGTWRWSATPDHRSATVARVRCPYGRPGDTLWVRETHAEWSEAYTDASRISYRADNHPEDRDLRWTPSILMPRRLCRQLLRNTSVRVERLSAIDGAGARAEGFASREAFIAGWHELYGAGDPWVWVIGFKKEDV